MKFERHNSSNQAASISVVSEPFGAGQRETSWKARRTPGIKRRVERDCFISIPQHFSTVKLTSEKWNYSLSDLEWWSGDWCGLQSLSSTSEWLSSEKCKVGQAGLPKQKAFSRNPSLETSTDHQISSDGCWGIKRVVELYKDKGVILPHWHWYHVFLCILDRWPDRPRQNP